MSAEMKITRGDFIRLLLYGSAAAICGETVILSRLAGIPEDVETDIKQRYPELLEFYQEAKSAQAAALDWETGRVYITYLKSHPELGPCANFLYYEKEEEGSALKFEKFTKNRNSREWRRHIEYPGTFSKGVDRVMGNLMFDLDQDDISVGDLEIAHAFTLPKGEHAEFVEALVKSGEYEYRDEYEISFQRIHTFIPSEDGGWSDSVQDVFYYSNKDAYIISSTEQELNKDNQVLRLASEIIDQNINK